MSPSRAAFGAARRIPEESSEIEASRVTLLALSALLRELETWPKPGLVSHVDSGSHDDMDAALFRESAFAIAPFWRLLYLAAADGADMAALRTIGIAAEAAMVAATGGINAHRGAIFGIGLLCAASGARDARRISARASLGETVRALWGAEILAGPMVLHSHGSEARRRFSAGGARAEAAAGFPSLYRIGLPALAMARHKAPGDPEAQRVETCFALIAALEDTNLLHRGGRDGLTFAQYESRLFLAEGGVAHPDWRDRAASIHRRFVRRRLSPGGAADLLAATLLVDAIEGVRES
ncbi:triphosphoribosyl-dephospho-CoA synthase [Kaistia soli DSM 19436]|uniref:Probable 2-(5''-triphosphoribosyl)-3'-dephosphocoenzyme-A synthase n=1 Tax=Kaistia soli DSM 19436 TaxID=1122133 RepID=A0A1M5L475_9HYPH|nr:triphosphoribosyl-dephospho-CoA synthase MdcB [Kaistia soli]SHG59750.1 triphosphoribosyl-dephospho-CoA synthase [Kaistia soli DSM 19436]